MGMQNIEGFGTFRKMDRQSVIGSFKASGSRDPDIMFLHKQKLIAPNKNLKLGAFGVMAFGVVLMIIPIFGIPVLLLGGWMWWFGRNNIKVVEAAYSEYMAAEHA